MSGWQACEGGWLGRAVCEGGALALQLTDGAQLFSERLAPAALRRRCATLNPDIDLDAAGLASLLRKHAVPPLKG